MEQRTLKKTTVLENYMAQSLHIGLYGPSTTLASFWYRQDIYFDLEVKEITPTEV